MAVTRRPTGQSRDECGLAELGYKQELSRSWSGFQNFAISFTIISILAGCFTTYDQAWNNGGPIAISWGWPIISIPILIIGFCMSELVSAYPTAGGIYWWASKLGGPVWGWFTGWFNLLGLIAILASVDYCCAPVPRHRPRPLRPQHLRANFGDAVHALRRDVRAVRADPRAARHSSTSAAATSSRCSTASRCGGTSLGVAVILGVLIFVPDDHASVDFVFTERINNSGFSAAACSGSTCCRSASC